MQKWEREVHAMIERSGLVAVHVEMRGGSKLAVTLRAANNETRSFLFANSNDPRARKNDEAILKRFAESNRAAPQLPFVRTAQRGSFVSADLPRIYVPLTESVPSLAEQRALLAEMSPTKPAEEKPVTPIKTANPTASRNTTKLNQVELHALYKWVPANVTHGQETSIADLCKAAGEALGFKVPESTMQTALGLEKIEISEPPVLPNDRIRLLAKEVARIQTELGMQHSGALKALLRGLSTGEAVAREREEARA